MKAQVVLVHDSYSRHFRKLLKMDPKISQCIPADETGTVRTVSSSSSISLDSFSWLWMVEFLSTFECSAEVAALRVVHQYLS